MDDDARRLVCLAFDLPDVEDPIGMIVGAGISREAASHGIDTENPLRKGLGLAGSIMATAMLAPVFGPAAPFFGGMLGKIVSMGKGLPGDRVFVAGTAEEIETFKKQFVAMKMAIGITEKVATSSRWENDAQRRMERAAQEHDGDWSPHEMYWIIRDNIEECLSDADSRLLDIFREALWEAENQLGV